GFALRAPAQFRLMFRPELVAPDAHPGVGRSTSRVFDTLVRSVVEAQAAGEVPAGDPMPFVLTCWSAVHGLATLWLDGSLADNLQGFGTQPQKLGAIVATTLGSLLAAAAGAPRRRYSSSSSRYRQRMPRSKSRQDASLRRGNQVASLPTR